MYLVIKIFKNLFKLIFYLHLHKDIKFISKYIKNIKYIMIDYKTLNFKY